MNKTPIRHLLVLLSALTVGAGSIQAQAVAPTSPANQPSSAGVDPEDEPIALDPFTVTTEHEGYRAVDTLGGARIRTKLVDTPSSITVVTKKLMDDLAVTNAEDLLVYTTSTEVGGLGGNYSGIAARGFGVVGDGEINRLVNPAGTNRARGLTAMDNTRNYFLSEIPWDGYNISRVDISRGPNSFLFGVGSPSGISNYSTNEAVYKDQGSLETRAGSHGSTRQALDYNKVLVPGQLAVRLDLVNDDTKYQQKPAFNHTKRAYGALRFDPQFLNTDSSYTRIHANFENGRVRSNNPRTLPPTDFITGYFDPSVNKAGYDPFNFVRSGASVGYDLSMSPWVTHDNIGYVFGSSPAFWFDGASGSVLRAAQSGAGGLKPAGIPGAGSGIGGLNGVGNAYHLHTVGYAHYVYATSFLDPNRFPGAAARTVNYLDKSLSDPSLFDFFNNLIDGPNKREWQDWNAYNISIVQSFMDDRLVFQAVAQNEKYKRGQRTLMNGPFITVDMDAFMLTTPSWLPGAQANPNVGRPVVGGSYSGGHKENFFEHENYQLTGSYTLKFDDAPDSALTRILGFHEFTGLYGRYGTERESRVANLFATDPAFGQRYTGGANINNRGINWAAYLGPTLRNSATGAGANLSRISQPIVPLSGPVTFFDNTWIGTVSPTAPWVNPMPNGNVNMTQADNPANYRGYQPTTVSILNADANINDLYTDGNKSEQVITSEALMYQGHFWDDAIIPSFGWRRDTVEQRGNLAPVNTVNGRSMNYEITDPGVELKTTSISYGVAVHLPKLLKRDLPGGTDISLYYFHGSNQTPRVRYGIDGTQLPSEEGETDDFSIQFDGFNGRASLRLTAFKTVDNHAQASHGQPLGAAGWLIDSLPMWTLTMAASGVAAAEHGAANLPADMQPHSWFWGWGISNPALAQQIAQVLKTDFVEMFPQSYWDNYGMGDWLDMAALQRGDWLHVSKILGGSLLTWNFPNTHLVHGVQPIIDQHLVSKGYELEATIRPTSNWDMTFNASRIRAYQTALGDSAANYLNNMGRLWIETPLGATPEWGGGPIRNEFLNNVWGPYLTQVALTGTDQPELRKWNFRFITNYKFNQGALRGLNVGGAYRWASKNIVGYGIKQATIFGNQAWIADVQKPLYGPTDAHFDMWIGYERKLTDKIDWKLQLNLRNVGEDDDLVPVAFQPDGSVAQQRILSGQSFDVSMKFMF
ncbi:MAG TPA: TonB-dependent receptor plug domain-containing protein [Opitutaceae bacterium]|nr:TonB-dependent receptor plug domain-containing protein [Opitutaceae bacterium]